MNDAPHHDPEGAFRSAGAHEERFTPPPPPRGRPFGRLRLLSLADAAAAPERRHLLKGLIAPGELSVWWGPPKSGKTFIVLRVVYGLALGRGMWNRKAKPCRVLYVAAEGESGFAARLLVLRDALGDAGEAFQYIASAAVMGPPSGDLADAIAAALAMRANLVVIDTLARTFGEGDENTAQDMSAYVGACDRLRTETGAHVAIVHHGTKEGATARGSGALLGAVDLSVRVSKGSEGCASTALVECSKDDASGAELPFRLRVVELAPDPDGDPRTTCMAEEAEAGAKPRKPLPQVARSALAVLATLILSEGAPIPPGELMPLHAKGVRDDRWRAECEARRLSLAESQKDRDRVFRHAVQALRSAGEIGMRSGWSWLLAPSSGADQGCEIP